MEKFLEGKVALVTGSTSGIGLGIAKALAKAGARIVLHGLGEKSAIDVLIRSFQEQEADLLYQHANLENPAEIEAMVQAVMGKWGQIDILVNNAGVQYVSSIEAFPPAKWEQIIRVDLIASFYTIHHIFPAMKKQKFGRIIHIASAHGLVASPYKSAYVAAKHGIIGLTKEVALEGAADNITCNAICPGYVDTPLVRKQIPEQAKTHHLSEKEVIEKIILGSHARKEFVTVEEIAELAVFLCSSHARSITGSALVMDCGWSAH